MKHFHKSSILDISYRSECASLLQMLSNSQSSFAVSLTLYFRHIQAFLRLIQPYLVLLKHIKSSSIFREYSVSAILRRILNATRNIQAQLDIFMYIKAYSEYMAYSGIFRTVYIFSQFQTHYSGITQQFMRILNLIWTDSGIFRTLAYLNT